MGNKKKSEQLGMPYGTACNRLRKKILFRVIQELGIDTCFQCSHIIERSEDMSMEHMTPWLDSEDPKALFWDLDNIAFSHITCNIGAARKVRTSPEKKRANNAKRMRDGYSPEERREKYLRTGH